MHRCIRLQTNNNRENPLKMVSYMAMGHNEFLTKFVRRAYLLFP